MPDFLCPYCKNKLNTDSKKKRDRHIASCQHKLIHEQRQKRYEGHIIEQ